MTGSLFGIDPVAHRPVLVALTLGAATLVLTIGEATIQRRPARAALRSRRPTRGAALATLKDVNRRGDIKHGDYVEPFQRLR